MKIELIVIGNELLNGKSQDKNVKWLASFAHDNHYELTGVSIIQDDESAFKRALDHATKSADLIITSGGLGPTEDDLTKQMMSEYFDCPIQESEKALKTAKHHYQRVNKSYQQDKFSYHKIPKDFMVFNNPVGFAPGLGYEYKKNKFVANAPGVPAEFKEMISQEIFAQISKHFPEKEFIQKHIIIKTWKVPEAKIFKKLVPDLWDKLKKFGAVSSLPHLGGVDIGVEIKSKNKDDLESKEKEIINLIKNTPLKDHIWHIGPESLEEVIIQKAKKKNLKIGFAESCTGGLCANRITDVSGSSSVFWGSIVSYSNEVKIKTLQVSEDTLKKMGAVSSEVAQQMAQGALKNMNLDIAVTTTGIAGPKGGSKEKPVGTIGIGIATKNNSSGKLYYYQGNREQLKYRFSQAALFILLEEIENYS